MSTLATQSGMHTSATQAITNLAIRLTSGDKDPIRGMKTPDGLNVFSAYDAMSNTGAYPSYGAVKAAWARLLNSEFKEEVVLMTYYLKFPGPGQRETPCMDIRGLQRLIALLGGKIGAEYRRLAETTLTRLIAGDESMISEIETNAASDAPIQTLAREALAHPSADIENNPSPVIESKCDDMFLARMPPGQRLAFIADLDVIVPLQERHSAATQALLRAECAKIETEAEAKVMVLRAEAEVTSARSAAAVNEAEAFGRKVATEKLQWETEDLRKRKAMDDVMEAGEVIQRFAKASKAERELTRFEFSAQIVSLIPSKRTRDRFVAKLVKASTADSASASASASASGVYVLKLSDNTYYVGQSTNKEARIEQHRTGGGASFTAELGSTSVSVAPFTMGQTTDLEAWERAETLERMHKHGINNVRGWVYVTPVMSPHQREDAFQQICARKQLCSTCGRPSHFAAQCFANGKATWALSTVNA